MKCRSRLLVIVLLIFLGGIGGLRAQSGNSPLITWLSILEQNRFSTQHHKKEQDVLKQVFSPISQDFDIRIVSFSKTGSKPDSLYKINPNHYALAVTKIKKGTYIGLLTAPVLRKPYPILLSLKDSLILIPLFQLKGDDYNPPLIENPPPVYVDYTYDAFFRLQVLDLRWNMVADYIQHCSCSDNKDVKDFGNMFFKVEADSVQEIEYLTLQSQPVSRNLSRNQFNTFPLKKAVRLIKNDIATGTKGKEWQTHSPICNLNPFYKQFCRWCFE